MVKYWLAISTLDNWKVVKEKHIWGVASRYRSTIQKVNVGDHVLIYTMQSIQDKEIIPSAVQAEYEVVSDLFEDSDPIFVTPSRMGEERFPLRIRLKPLKKITKPIMMKPLVPELSFIKNKTMWSGAIRTAMREIPESDYRIIMAAGK
jgi:predicted RNA-binding protein